MNTIAHGRMKTYEKTGTGFSRQEDDVQKRFPLWLWCYDFYRRNDSLAYQFIRNHSGVPFTSGDLNKRRLAACMCARSNHFQWRSTFYHLCVQNGIEVKCPSSVCHNDQCIEVGERGVTKAKYISNFVFNICPENTVTSGYCTEKLSWVDVFPSIGAIMITKKSSIRIE